MPAFRIATPAMARATVVTTPRSPAMMPSSTRCFTSSGSTTTIAASTTVTPRNAVIRRRCGTAKPNTRRTVPRLTRLSTALRSERRCLQAEALG